MPALRQLLVPAKIEPPPFGSRNIVSDLRSHPLTSSRGGQPSRSTDPGRPPIEEGVSQNVRPERRRLTATYRRIMGYLANGTWSLRELLRGHNRENVVAAPCV